MSPLVSSLSSRWMFRAVRVVLGGMFLTAGVIKLNDPQQLAVVIDAFGLMPHGLVMPFAYFLPCIELVAGIGLLFNLRGCLTAIAIMTLLFLVVLGYGLHLGLDIDCGCYGPGDPEAGAFSGLRDAFKRDLLILVGVVYCYWWRWNAKEGSRVLLSQLFSRSKEKTHA